MDSLAVALPIFLISGVLVVVAGIGLARFGEDLAEQTGWGQLWVGTILVSVATSLPELLTNASAVLIDEAPLALGTVFGANMKNMWTVALVAVFFGVSKLFAGQGRATRRLATTAVVLGALAVGFATAGDFALGPFSLGALVIGVGYIIGMRLVFSATVSDGAEATGEDTAAEEVAGGAARAWIGFSGAALVIVMASPLLALSAGGIADATGLASSFMGVIAVAVVTTLPEVTVSVAAAFRRSYGLVLGSIYGSCAFNTLVITLVDPLHGNEPILRAMGPEHFVAGGTAVGLMLAGLLVLQSYRNRSISFLRGLVPVMVVAYPLSLVWVFVAA